MFVVVSYPGFETVFGEGLKEGRVVDYAVRTPEEFADEVLFTGGAVKLVRSYPRREQALAHIEVLRSNEQAVLSCGDLERVG
jgi:hypothetical protein